MRPSFVRLVVTSVLATWAIGGLTLWVYARSQSWTSSRARTDGVFLMHELVNAVPVHERSERLRGLQPNFDVPFRLVSTGEVEDRVGRPIAPGEHIPHRISPREEWYYLVFSDGQGALAAGPVIPAIPRGFFPIGIVVALIALPALAGLFSVRVERELAKVEQASKALAAGKLNARVDNADGPSNELATTFNAMAERIEHLVRSRDELVQAVSHELGLPLSRLRFHMELLQTQDSTHRDDRLRMISHELDAIENLVAELLSYLQSDEFELQPRGFSLERVVNDLTELARLDIPEDRRIQVHVQISGSPEILADPRLFQRATENVLRNAMHYAAASVRIVIDQLPDGILVAVHDDGPGIPEELREKVLLPFVRADPNRSRRTGGVGLGLAIVARIVQQHRGSISIQSSPLGGVCVAIVWPGDRPPAFQARSNPASAQRQEHTAQA